MTDADPAPADRVTLFCMHFLGGSGREWRRVAELLHGALRLRTIDFDGFGDASDRTGHSVQAMADRVAGIVRDAAPARWLLVGHSMGAKIATAVARRAEDGEAGLHGFAGLVLLAGSPPSPEPMEHEQRQTMLGWFGGDAETSRAQAQHYISRNVGAPLDERDNQQTVDDVLRAGREGWIAWLTSGSREDWSEHVGRLRTPTLIIAGEKDGALGPEAQHALAARHFDHARVVTLPAAGHLLPLERPAEVARLIAEHAGCLPGIGHAYAELLFSERTSARTRQVLLERAAPDDPTATPTALTPELMALLQALIGRVLPQSGVVQIDLAARLDALLAADPGDGWRHDPLPGDAAAYRAGLRTLEMRAQAMHKRGFAALGEPVQDAMLRAIAEAAPVVMSGEGLLDARQMQLWFEDVRADAVKLYVAHPATLSRMGYSGTFYGGDGERKPGFARIGAGEREAWEPPAWEPPAWEPGAWEPAA